jgi:hypothetical protein
MSSPLRESAADAPSFTPQADGPTSVPPRRGPRPPYYLLQAFHSIVGYSLWYVGDNVLHGRELASLAVLLQLPPKALMLFLRLATRSQQYFPIARLRETYGADGSVRRRTGPDDMAGSGSSSKDSSSSSDDERDDHKDDDNSFTVNGQRFFGGDDKDAAEQFDGRVNTLAVAGALRRLSLGDIVAEGADLQSQSESADPTSNTLGGGDEHVRRFLRTTCRVKELQEMLLLAGIDATSEASKMDRRLSVTRVGAEASPLERRSSAAGSSFRGAKRGPMKEESRGIPRRSSSSVAVGNGATDNNNTQRGRGNSTAARGAGRGRGGARPAPLAIGKDLLVDIATANAPILAAGPWDAVIGDCVKVTPGASAALQTVSEIFALITGFAPDTPQHSGASAPPLPSVSAVLAAVRSALFPVQLPYVPCCLTQQVARLSQTNEDHRDAAKHDDENDEQLMAALADPNAACPRPMRFAVFPTRRHLDLCLAAQQFEQRLFFLVEDDGRRLRGTATFSEELETIAAAVRQGLKESEALLSAIAPSRGHERPARISGVRKQDDSDDETGRVNGLNWPPHETDVECLLLSRAGASSPATIDGSDPSAYEGGPYDHLACFLPTYRYLRCAARLVDAFEMDRKYDAAVSFLRTVLNTRIEVRRKWHDETSKSLLLKSRSVFFQLRKRGEWHHRLVLDLSRHLKRDEAAVAHCEVLYGVTGKEASAVVLPDEIRCTVRRSDRLNVDRAMQRLYAPPRRWNGLPPDLLLKTITDAPKNNIRGQRDAAGNGREWLHGADGSGSVEAAALAWYTGGRGRKERGWQGVHCEGGWLSAMFAIVLHDALYALVDREAVVFLTPFQTTPLDMALPEVFYRRRADAIDSAVSRLETMEQAHFAAMVDEYIARHRGETSDFVPWDLQLSDIAKCVPLKPLAVLLRTLALQRDGHYIRFSGVPDLVLFRLPSDAPSGRCGRETFLMSEVKSPTDRLSEKQRAMNDLLLRCGFYVEVCHVYEDLSEELTALGRAGIFENRVNIRGAAADDDDDEEAAAVRAEAERDRRRMGARQQRQEGKGQDRKRQRNTPHSPTQV